jgi:DNA-binding beta-propeller fold protein YncE
MKVDVTGKLTVLVQGAEGERLAVPHHLVLDNQDNLYSVGDRDGAIWRIASDAKATRFFPSPDEYAIGFIGRWGDPFTMDSLGNIYAINSRPDKFTQIVRFDSDGRITVLAGGNYGIADGQGSQAGFGDLHGGCFAWGRDGSLYVTDSLVCIRKINSSGVVTTLIDALGKRLQFRAARGLACDLQGNLYVADTAERRIYKVTSTGSVTPLAGSGKSGTEDGPSGVASFQAPVGVAVGRDGAVYVLDYLRADPSVRKIRPDGMVTTIATTVGSR